MESATSSSSAQQLPFAVIRFAGDSGDGMQLTGARFTQESARLGNDLATRPDFPAEIRAPAGTLGGVSAFQIQFGSERVYTSGDDLDALVAMNPAAMKANLRDLKPNGLLICNADTFVERNLTRVGYTTNPIESREIKTRFHVVPAPITALTFEATKDLGLNKSAQEKCKNFFALGIICHIYSRDVQQTEAWIAKKFAKKPALIQANTAALHGGMAYAEAAEVSISRFEIHQANLPSGTYRNVTGNQGIAFGLLAASQASSLPLYYSGYPITPASEILHEVSRFKSLGARTLQAEDEIAACCSAIGASYGGNLAVTASSGPGILLKQEAIGLAVTAELPLVIINVQRAGPSTGLPTKTEQADLLEVLFGRNGECPLVVIAIAQPEDAFRTTLLACKIALEHMTPVFLLSDGAIGNGSQPWRIPDLSQLDPIEAPIIQNANGTPYQPYARDPESLVRRWAIPGTAGLEHRLGGLEKQDGAGNISYDPANHERMVGLRAEKIERIAQTVPPVEISGDGEGDALLISWGSTYGAVAHAVSSLRRSGHRVGHIHLRMLNPFPRGLVEAMTKYTKVIVPELNSGQLLMLLRAKFLVDAQGISKVQGQPFRSQELIDRIEQIMQEARSLE